MTFKPPEETPHTPWRAASDSSSQATTSQGFVPTPPDGTPEWLAAPFAAGAAPRAAGQFYIPDSHAAFEVHERDLKLEADIQAIGIAFILWGVFVLGIDHLSQLLGHVRHAPAPPSALITELVTGALLMLLGWRVMRRGPIACVIAMLIYALLTLYGFSTSILTLVHLATGSWAAVLHTLRLLPTGIAGCLGVLALSRSSHVTTDAYVALIARKPDERPAFWRSPLFWLLLGLWGWQIVDILAR